MLSMLSIEVLYGTVLSIAVSRTVKVCFHSPSILICVQNID